MQTIILTLAPEKLANPDLDLRYLIPDRLEEFTNGRLQDNGYDYIDREGADSDGSDTAPLMAVWLAAEDAAALWPQALELFRQEKILDNDLASSAEIYISEEDAAELADCRRVWPI